MADDPKSVGDILDRLEEIARDQGDVSVGAIVEAMGRRSHGPLLLLPSLIDIAPIGGIPGLPTALGLIILLVAAQLLLGRNHLWLPSFLRRRSLSREKACEASKRLRPVANFMDRWFHGRLAVLAHGPFTRIAAAICILLALTVPPLELVPFATTAPMGAIAAFGLALFVRDGLLMIIAAALSGGAIAVGVAVINGSGG